MSTTMKHRSCFGGWPTRPLSVVAGLALMISPCLSLAQSTGNAATVYFSREVFAGAFPNALTETFESGYLHDGYNSFGAPLTSAGAESYWAEQWGWPETYAFEEGGILPGISFEVSLHIPCDSGQFCNAGNELLICGGNYWADEFPASTALGTQDDSLNPETPQYLVIDFAPGVGAVGFDYGILVKPHYSGGSSHPSSTPTRITALGVENGQYVELGTYNVTSQESMAFFGVASQGSLIRRVTIRGDAGPEMSAFELLDNVSLYVPPTASIGDAVAELPADYFQAAAGGLPNAVQSILDAVNNLIAAGDYAEAIQKLVNLRRRVDGCDGSSVPDPNDWIIDCDSQAAVRSLIDQLLQDLANQP